MGPRRLKMPIPFAWAGVLALALLTVVSASLLVGYSVWFLSTVSVVGLGAAAYTFNFHIPAAIIRMLALTRVSASLGERLWGHRLALGEQARHRLRHFAQAARRHDLGAQNWQLARGDALHGFMNVIEALEFRMLRVRIPAAYLVLLAFLLLGVAFALSWSAALVLVGAFALTAGLAWRTYGRIQVATLAWHHDLEASGSQLADLAFSARSLRGSGALDAHLERWYAREQTCEDQRQNVQMTALWLERALWTLGLATAVIVLFLVPGEIGARAAFLAFWTLAVFAVFAQLPGMLTAQAASAVARHTLLPQAKKASLPPLRIDPVSVRAALERGPVCLMGASGSGKTLALKALAQDLQAEGLRVGVALHDAAVLQMSWRANLDPTGQASEAALFAALDLVDLKTLCQARGGLDAPLDGQSALSSGQAHRLGLARLLVGGFDAALIDELGEHLSPDHRRALAQKFSQAWAQRPLLITTHDPEVAAQFEQVFDLH